MLLFEDMEWVYRLYPLDEAEDRFGPLAAAVRAWRGKFDGNRLPTWPQFTLFDFTELWSLASVFDVLDAGEPRFRVRFWGSGLNRLQEGDWTGRIISSESVDEKSMRLTTTSADLRYYRMICRDRKIGLTHGPVEVGNKFLGSVDEVALPLGDGGTTVRHILFVMYEDKKRRIDLIS